MGSASGSIRFLLAGPPLRGIDGVDGDGFTSALTWMRSVPLLAFKGNGFHDFGYIKGITSGRTKKRAADCCLFSFHGYLKGPSAFFEKSLAEWHEQNNQKQEEEQQFITHSFAVRHE